MKTIAVFFLVVLFGSETPEYKNALEAKVAPTMFGVIETESMEECQATQIYAERLAARRGDTIIRNECVEVKFPTRPETTL